MESDNYHLRENLKISEEELAAVRKEMMRRQAEDYQWYQDAVKARDYWEDQAKKPWVSVQAALPHHTTNCLILNGASKVFIAFYLPQRQGWLDSFTGKPHIKVTHWMELPQPPFK